MNCLGHTFDTEEGIVRAARFCLLHAFLPPSPLLGQGRGREERASGATGVPEGQGVGTRGKRGVASFSLLPLIMDFLIKITRTMSARNASTCFYFSR